MHKNITEFPTMKALETQAYRYLQKTFVAVMEAILTDFDQRIADGWDKRRYLLKHKRQLRIDCLHGTLTIKRNY